MNKLPKEKRERLILVIIGTVGLLFLISFVLIRPQYDAIDQIRSQTASARMTLEGMVNTIKKGGNSEDKQSEYAYTISHAEDDMASGDAFSWTFDTLRNFKSHYKVEIPTIGQPTQVGEVDLLPKFPYKQLKVSVAGTAYYHDLGKFIADFENTFPHIRITNLTVDSGGATMEGAEKLAFRMDIVALVKPMVSQN